MKNKDGIVRKGMKMRRLAVLLGACLLLPSANLHALGMGDIDVHSGLNQPLDATIQLISVDEAELMQLEVVLAPQDAFERMGLERVNILQRLEFEVVTDRGVSFVKVSSTVPIREPFLDFILTVSWANGQMLREYTLLLDPPIFDDGQSPSTIEAAVTTPSTIARNEVDRVADVAERDVDFSPTEGSSYGPTKRSDTLWAVAKQMRGDISASVPQMMLALLKENPEAFFNNNVNNLKAGYILRAPQEQDITAISRVQAAAQANEQYQEWLANKGMAPVSGARQLASGEQAPMAGAGSVSESEVAGSTQSMGAPASDSDARLQIVSPDDTVAGSGSGAEVEAMQQQLAMALASSEVSRQENADLKQRLIELESQLANMQRLMSLQDGTLSELQGAAMEPAASVPVDVEQSSVADSTAMVAEMDAPGVVEPVVQAPVEVVKPVIAGPTPVMADEAPISLIDDLLADPKMLAAIAGGGVAFLVLILVMMRRRKAENDDFFETEDASLVGKSADSGGAKTTPLVDDDAGKVAPDSAKDDDFVADLADLSSGSDDFSGFGNDLGSIHAEESEIDPIAEADVYLAYRRYEQAEALLKEAIQADDGRSELKVKLLEIYFTTKDKEAFEAQSEGLYASLAGAEDGLWEQVVEMGRELCPEHPLFSEGGPSMLNAGDDAFDLAEESIADPSDNVLGEMAFDSLSEPESLPDVSVSLDSDLDLDLDLDSEFDFGELDGSDLLADNAVGDELDFSSDLDVGDVSDFNIDDSLELDASKEKVGVEDSKNKKLDPGPDALDELSGLDDVATESNNSGLDEALVAEDGSSFLNEDFELDTGELVMDEGSDELVHNVDSAPETDSFVDDFVLDEGAAVADKASLDTLDDLPDFLDGVAPDSRSSADNSTNKEKASNYDGIHDSILDDSSDFDMDFASSLDEFESLDNVVSFDSQDSASKNKPVDAPLQANDVSDFTSEMDGLSDVLSDETSEVSLDMDLDGLDLGGLELGDEVSAGDDAASSIVDADPTGSEWEIEPAISSFGDMDEEYSLFESTDDVVGTKLDLAKAYIDMGDQDGARSILDEVVKEGSDTQREEAEQLMIQIG